MAEHTDQSQDSPFPPEFDLPLDEFYALREKQGKEGKDAFIEEKSRELGATIYAMYVGTLTKDGRATPKTCIFIYRVKRMLEICNNYAQGKIKRLPKNF